ncbi:MAG: preprotein translocase subunit SecY [Deltaproteobacteria bacterium]|nr:MAG: preprotein translocase subunit SecY [Deltaproteobacteria bacterium]
MVSTLTNIAKIPELRARILFTLGLLAIYRLGVFVTTPGVDRSVMTEVIAQRAGFLGLFNLFTGGALEQLSIFALGIMPYISAAIILQLLAVVVPTLERLKKEGEQGRKKITQYTRYGTVLLALIQGTGIAFYLENLNDEFPGLVTVGGLSFRLITIIALTTGTVFLMWLGEQITERGIGNGISLIIFAGIIAGFPAGAISTMEQVQRGEINPLASLILLVLILATVAFIVFVERAQRRIPVQYAKRTVGRKVYSGQASYLPLKVNTSGVIPPIFASSILIFPSTMAGYFQDAEWASTLQIALNPLDWRYNVLYVILIIFFCFFYTAVTFNPVDVADNMKRAGSFVPGIRPGKKTAEYIDYVLTRITTGGALYVAAVCVLPVIMMEWFPISFLYGGTGLLIVVSVGLDTVQQIEGHLISRHYEGLTGQRMSRIRDNLTPSA